MENVPLKDQDDNSCIPLKLILDKQAEDDKGMEMSGLCPMVGFSISTAELEVLLPLTYSMEQSPS